MEKVYKLFETWSIEMIPYLPILFVNCIFSTILYNEGREPIAQQSSYIPFILPVTYLEAAMILHMSHINKIFCHICSWQKIPIGEEDCWYPAFAFLWPWYFQISHNTANEISWRLEKCRKCMQKS